MHVTQPRFVFVFVGLHGNDQRVNGKTVDRKKRPIRWSRQGYVYTAIIVEMKKNLIKKCNSTSVRICEKISFTNRYFF